MKLGSTQHQDLRRPKRKAASVVTSDEEDSAPENAIEEKVNISYEVLI